MKRILLFCIFFIKYSLAIHHDYKISEIHYSITSKKVKCTDVINYFLKRAYKYNSFLNAIISFNPKALNEAVELDNFFHKNKKLVGKLHCIPVLVKDNIAVKDMPTTGGINALRYSIPNKDAFVIQRLKEEGAIVIAKTNLAEMAFYSYDSEMGGACKNPWDLTRSCSRSSSGSGCSIAAGLGLISIGTDTDGSIMGPASYNGVFGLRPPHGQTNMDGIIMLLKSDDTVGPFSQYLDDLVLTYSIMIDEPSLYNHYMNSTIITAKNMKHKDIRIGYVKNFLTDFSVDIGEDGTFYYKLDDDVIEAMQKAIYYFKSLNIDVVELEIPEGLFNEMLVDLKDIYIARYYGCAVKCFRVSIDNYFNDTERFQFDSKYHSSEDFKNNSLLSSFFSNFINNNANASTCVESCKVYDILKNSFSKQVESWFKLTTPEVDSLLFPTSVIIPHEINDTSFENYFGTSFIAAFSGYASLNIPIHFTNSTKTAPDGLPVGVMLLSSEKKFPKMLKTASFFEQQYLKRKIFPKSVPDILDSCSSNGEKLIFNYNNNNYYYIFFFSINIMYLNKFF